MGAFLTNFENNLYWGVELRWVDVCVNNMGHKTIFFDQF
jgi:hypothetical protein